MASNEVKDLSSSQCRQAIRGNYLADEHQIIHQLIFSAALSQSVRARISQRGASLIQSVRQDSTPTLMEKFLAEYGLTTKEGVALMCLAEALLRVPDSVTIDALIEDKIGSGNWREHRGKAASSLINTTTWGLMVASKMISASENQGLADTLRGLVKRMGEPMVRTVAGQAMKEMGRQFVLGRTIEEAQKRGKKYEAKGYTYSYDMLGEAARTDADAQRYLRDYANAIDRISAYCSNSDIRENPGISVKLSALHARYEYGQLDRVVNELAPRALELAKKAKVANMGFNIDAEEMDRLDISLDVIERVLSDPELAGWDGFGVVVQAYSKRASSVLDWLYALSNELDRKIMVRLVKGAYWDAEIKRAQVLGLNGFPVFTRKACSDVSYMACAKKLLSMTDRIYPQFATHNAHSAAAILEMADDKSAFEFQRLHGMGESLHEVVLSQEKTRCRIYAPVGAHQDLLAYLVRRLLENGANSSFVNQIVDVSISPETIAKDPIEEVQALGEALSSQHIAPPSEIFGKDRKNAQGWDITDPLELESIEAIRVQFKSCQWQIGPLMHSTFIGGDTQKVINPADPDDDVGRVIQATAADVAQAITDAQHGFIKWSERPASQRAALIQKAGDLFEQHAFELFAIAHREAGKTLLDGVAEIREAVDFARYYAGEAERLAGQAKARGVISCISPWNFPLAIFAGQVFAALAAGNTVVAKPAEQTAVMAHRAVQLMYEAGIPSDVIQLLPGRGAVVGTAMTSDPRVSGVCFTGSTATAQRINRTMAETLPPQAPLIAETGGLNAMIVDSTALPEQVVRDVLASSFQSAGQRCSALRMLYVQKDIADHLLKMLFGAMDELSIGNPWQLSTDVGPVIDSAAKAKIDAHCQKFAAKGQVLKQLKAPERGLFVPPTVIRLSGIEELEEEIFGPVLHVATFDASEINAVVDSINSKGFGLTFGLHTRVDGRVEQITKRINVGNCYVNRNQIGAIVGSQPFGGEGLSGTGPKAGGPHYVRRFMMDNSSLEVGTDSNATVVSLSQAQNALQMLSELPLLPLEKRLQALTQVFGDAPPALDAQAEMLPGPTGELNRLSCHARGIVLCVGPDSEALLQQVKSALSQGNKAIAIAPNAVAIMAKATVVGLPLVVIDGVIDESVLTDLNDIQAVASNATHDILRSYRQALAKREGALIPLITEHALVERFVIERHFCMDTTAAGGNASLIAASE